MVSTPSDRSSAPAADLAAAARFLRDAGPGALFREDREDVAVEFDSRGGAVPRSTRASGWAFEPDRPAAPRRHASGGLPGAGSGARPPRLDPARALAVAEGLLETVPASADGWAVEIAGRVVELEQAVALFRSDGEPRSDLRRGRRVRLDVALVRGARRATATVEWVGRAGARFDPGRLLAAAIERARARRDRVEASPGEGAAVFAPGTGGVLVHEIVGHALEGDVTVAGGSALVRERARFRNRSVRIADDPRRGRAPWRIDDEGVEARAVPLVQDGRVCGRLHDLASARRARSAPSGHGRRGSYLDPVLPRMGCTFLLPGEEDPDAVLTETRSGWYVRRMEAASVDPHGGRALFRVTDADVVRDGRLERAVDPFLMEVTLADTLSTLDRVAHDLEFDRCVGSCVRDGQALAVSVGAPTFRLGLVRVLKSKNLKAERP